MGHVGYCAAFVTSTAAASAGNFLVVGGEESCVKVYSVPKLDLQQEISLSMNSSLKALSVSASGVCADRGVAVGGGGKLQYYIWLYDFTQRTRSKQVLFTGSEGTVWARATQDHRILSVQCSYLSADSAVDPKYGDRYSVERYLVLLCDSRGTATIGLFTHSLLGCGVQSGKLSVRFDVLQQWDASQCPLLSSHLGLVQGEGHTLAEVLAVVGDTAGTVSVWRSGLKVLDGR
jgi:hypothetical protein